MTELDERLKPVLNKAMVLSDPPPKRAAWQWANENRVLPKRSAEPGPWRSDRVPWIKEITEAIASPRHESVYVWMGTQLSKTDGIILNTLGWKMTDNPVPSLLICPTEKNAGKISAQRLSPMIAATPSLNDRLEKGKREQKYIKTLAGVEISIGWSGSKTDSRSDSVGLILTDEVDVYEPLPGEGDFLGSINARRATFPGSTMVCTSTGTIGSIEAVKNEETGLYHWQPPEENEEAQEGEEKPLQSRIAELFFQGTRAEWAVPCTGCGDYFVPRVIHLRWPEGATPMSARKKAWLECPHCEHEMYERDKNDMNQRGRFVCPGQSIDKAGNISGPDTDNVIASFWVSGLMSPWVSLGKWAFDFVKAFKSKDPDVIQTVVNQSGELYAQEGEKVDWQRVAELRMPYSFGEVLEGVIKITCGVDVGLRQLHYAVRGWGLGLTSWGIDVGEIDGDVDSDEVWDRLDDVLDMDYGGMPIHYAAVDSGYMPMRVYDFCKSRTNTIPTKGGRDSMDLPYYSSRIEVTSSGRRIPGGVTLWHFNAGMMKTWLHSRYKIIPGVPGSFNLSRDAHDTYCRHMTNEQKITDRKGRTYWKRMGPNHWFDAEVLNVLLSKKEQFHTLKPKTARRNRRNRNQGGWLDGVQEQWG